MRAYRDRPTGVKLSGCLPLTHEATGPVAEEKERKREKTRQETSIRIRGRRLGPIPASLLTHIKRRRGRLELISGNETWSSHRRTSSIYYAGGGMVAKVVVVRNRS